MFYTELLLKRGGSLHPCWVASTYRARLKRSMLRAPLPHLCDQVMAIMALEASEPERKFSLRLTCRLVHGMTIIYDKQVMDLLNDCIHFFGSICAPKIPNKRANKTPQRVPNDNEEIEEFPFLVRNFNNITLPEDPVFPKEVAFDNFGDERIQTVDDLFEAQLPLVRENPDDIVQPEISTILELVEPQPDISCVVPEINILPAHPVVEPLPQPMNETAAVNKWNHKRNRDEEITPGVELEEYVPTKKLRKKKKSAVKIDKEIILSGDYMRSMQRNDVHLRCKTPRDDIYQNPIYKTAEELLSQPAICRYKNLSAKLANRYKSNLHPVSRKFELLNMPQEAAEVVIGEMKNSMLDATSILTIEQNKSQDTFLKVPNESIDIIKETSVEAAPVHPSISIIEPDVTNFTLEMNVTECHVEVTNTEAQIDATVQNNYKGTDETMLGSLDRTKVSLGDVNASVEERRNKLDREWGVDGFMTKLKNAKAAGITPTTIEAVVQKEYESGVITESQRMIAAKCFASLLLLCTDRRVTVEKKPGSLEIADIKVIRQPK